jgi:hypothetical protein
MTMGMQLIEPPFKLVCLIHQWIQKKRFLLLIIEVGRKKCGLIWWNFNSLLEKDTHHGDWIFQGKKTHSTYPVSIAVKIISLTSITMLETSVLLV